MGSKRFGSGHLTRIAQVKGQSYYTHFYRERKPPVTPSREGIVRHDHRISPESVERGMLTRRLKSVKVTLPKMPWETE